MKPLRSILTAGLALAFSAAPARAITYPVLADTAGSPKTTRIAKTAGRATTLPVSANSNAYIAFGVAGSLNAPAPGSVTAARLIIYFQTVTKPGSLTVFLAKANEVGQFTETFTTATQGIPAAGANIAVDPTFPVNATLTKNFFIIDVTAEVVGWLNNPASEFGFGIKSDGIASVLLGAKEGTGNGYPAELEVDVATAGTKGDKGDPGPKGDKGDPGTNGINGTNGTSPVVTFGTGAAADQLSINGTISGPHLTGPAGSGATLADGSVTTAKLADNAVTPAKLNLLSGAVGIGTATPRASFEVVNNAANAGVAYFSNLSASGFAGAYFAQGLNVVGDIGYVAASSTFGGPGTMQVGSSGGDLVFSANTTTTYAERLRIKADTGNVGIGTAAPAYAFTVQTAAGSAGLVHTDGTITVGTLTVPTGNMGWIGTFSNHPLGFFTNSTGPLMTLLQSGNFGIGTSNPGALLDLSSTVAGKEHLRLSGKDRAGNSDSNGVSLLLGVNTVGPPNRQLWIGDSTFLSSNTTNPIIRLAPLTTAAGGCLIDAIATNGTTSLPLKIGSGGALFISAAGNVGVGTTTPIQARLVVNNNGVGSVPLTSPHGYLGSTGATTFANDTVIDNSIYADGNIIAFQFWAFSDERLKNIRGPSDGAADLRTLEEIEITDYTMKDTVANGSKPYKKVIAQQVEKVYPQAVNHSTDVIPDIYQKATMHDGWVQLATDLKVGDRVRLIAAEAQGIHEVLAVEPGRFRTDFQPADAEVFVYGREVNDFRQVDYEAIAMLNVSATQELARQLEAKDREIATLKAANLALAGKMATFGEQLTALQATRDNHPPRAAHALLRLK